MRVVRRLRRLLPLLLALPTVAQERLPEARDLRPLLRAHLDAFRKEHPFPGGVLALIADGTDRPVAVATGLRDARDTDDRVQTDDRFLAGSIGKTLFAALALCLIEERKLALDDRVAKHLPDLENLPHKDTLTLRHLLNHSSGLREHLANPAFVVVLRENPTRSWTPEALLAFSLVDDPLFTPGAGWAYADTNYIATALVLERATGLDPFELIRKRFLEPHRLTGIVRQSRRVPRLVQGHCHAGRAFGFAEFVLDAEGRFAIDPAFEHAGGGFAATAPDLCRWTRLFFSGRQHGEKVFALAIDSVAARTGPDQRYGLGIQLRESAHGPVRYHGGWFPGYMAETAHYPDAGLTLTIMVNSDHHTRPGAFQAFLDRIVDALRD